MGIWWDPHQSVWINVHVHVVFSTIPISPMQNTDTFKWFLFTTFWLQLSSTQSHLPLCDMDNNLGLAFRQIAAERANQQAVPTHQALQRQWFEQRASRKRAAPTPQETPASTPKQEPEDAEMEARPTEAEPSLFQPIVMQDDVSANLTAAQAAGIAPNDQAAVHEYYQGLVTTREDVFQIVRAYHVGVIRPELYNLVVQVESVVKNLDDRMLRLQQDCSWLLTESRLAQKQACGLQLLLSGFDNKMGPTDRLYQIHWMLTQVAVVRRFVEQRGFDTSNEEDFQCLNALSIDPVTPPSATGGHSGITILHFKAWEVRQSFLEAFGGTSGAPLYWDPNTPVPNKHIRCTPSSPQFQRKLESPLRVVLQVLNQDPHHPNPQLTILWKTLTVMDPQTNRDFEPQMTACCRLHYVQTDGTLQGRLEVTPSLLELMNTKSTRGDAEDQTIWQFCWSSVMYGNQIELDDADRLAVEKSKHVAGKGIPSGKGRRHWTHQHIWFNGLNPFPLDLDIVCVEEIAYCWDEYCDKFGKASEKLGDYAQSTYKGRPPAVATSKAASLVAAKGGGKRTAPATPER